MANESEGGAEAPAEKKRTYKECVAAAVALERAARWTEAAALWDEARRASKTAGTRDFAKMKVASAKRNAAEFEEGAPAAQGAVAPAEVETEAETETEEETETPAPEAPETEAAAEAAPEETTMPKDEKKVAAKVAKKPAQKKTAAKSTATAAEKAHEDRLALRERQRAKQNQLKPGAKLEHSQRGKVTATCTYVGERDFRFHNKSYTSISAAANAAAEHLGMKSRSLNGWIFWGVEKKEESET